jgi:hypothetical protein
MNNKKKILISLAASSLITYIICYSIFKIPNWLFPLNFKISIILISFISTALSIFLVFTYTSLFRQQIIDDKRRKMTRSNFLIAFFSVTIIWGILFGLSVYDSSDKIVPFLLNYGPGLPLGILIWYVIISLIRKERYLIEHKTPDENITKIEPAVGTKENIEGIIITEGGYPAHGYDLIFTDQRLIINDAGPTIGGLHVSKGDKKSTQYVGLNPEQILRSYNCNWAYYRDVEKADLKKGIIYTISIKTPSFTGKYYFKRHQYQQAENLFNKFLYLKSSSGRL